MAKLDIPRKKALDENFLNKYGAESALLIHSLCSIAVGTVVQKFLLEKICLVNLGYSEDVCIVNNRLVENYEEENIQIQKMAGHLTIVWSILDSIFPLFLVIFIGAWSDKYGKKLPMLFVVFGFILQNIALLMCVFFTSSLGGWTVVIVTSLLPSLTGSNPCFTMAIFSYVVANIPVEQRTARTGIAHNIRILGVSLGYGIAGIVSSFGFSHTFVFSTSLCLELLTFFIIYYGVNNHEKQLRKPFNEMAKDLFNKDQFTSTFSVLTKPRPNNRRGKLLLLLAVYLCAYTPIMGEASVMFLFGRHKFSWDVSDVGAFMSYRLIVGFLGNMIVVGLLLQKYKLTDPVVGIIGCLAALATASIGAIANSTFIMYLGTVLGILRGGTRIIPKCILSKIVSTDELGKMYSFLGFIDSVAPLLGGLIYTTLYTKTFEVYPGSFYIASIAFAILQLLSYGYLYREPIDTIKKE